MSNIGIAISSRNRPAHLNVCLAHFIAYSPTNHNVNILVCDDNSTEDNALENKRICSHWGVNYYYHTQRIGIAANKNFGLAMMQNNHCIFLFDDDSFPNDVSWSDTYITSMHRNHVHHLTYTPWRVNKRTERDGLYISDWGMGCCMFFSKELIETIGGFDEKYNTYGFEHLAYGRRAFASGMNQDYGAYLTPVDAIGQIFTIDYEYRTLKKQPSMCTIDFEHLSCTEVDVSNDVVKHNHTLFDECNDALYVKLPSV